MLLDFASETVFIDFLCPCASVTGGGGCFRKEHHWPLSPELQLNA